MTWLSSHGLDYAGRAAGCVDPPVIEAQLAYVVKDANGRLQPDTVPSPSNANDATMGRLPR